MQVRIDARDPVPPFRQIVDQILDLVAGDQLQSGHRLPPVRQLAADLGLANGTVARAYRELEESGVLETRGRAGTFVAEAARASHPDRTERLRRDARRLVQTATRLGARGEEVRRAVEEALADRTP